MELTATFFRILNDSLRRFAEVIMDITQTEKILIINALTDMVKNPNRNPTDRMMADRLREKFMFAVQD